MLTPPFSRGKLSVKEMFFDINKRLKCGSVRIYILLIKRVIETGKCAILYLVYF
jgi:hypothetical protein